MQRTIISLIFFLIIGMFGYAQAQTEVTTKQAQLNLLVGSYDTNGNISLGLHYKLQPGWHIYWRDPGDNGFAQALDWQKSTNIDSPNLLWPAPTRNIEKITDTISTESYIYKDDVLFPIKAKAQNKTEPTHIKLHVNYAICKDICIPEQADFSIDIKPSFYDEKTTLLISKHLSKIPQESGQNGIVIEDVELNKQTKNLQISVSAKQGIEDADIFIEAGSDYAFYNPKLSLDSNGTSAIFYAPIKPTTNKQNLEAQDIKITLKVGDHAVEKTINNNQISETTSLPPNNSPAASIWLILLFGLIGGLILNFMPCVLPVLSIKLISVIKHSGSSKTQIAKSFLITALGIITSFIALASLAVMLRFIGINAGWGFHFQEPAFIIFLVIVLTLFTANILGFYEFRIPGISSRTYQKSLENNSLGSFLTGILATILATPCTAPFLGTAVGFALSKGTFEIMSIFTVMGIGMALPYLFFSAFPQLVTKLPKPGAWMITVKKIMGMFLIITIAWLVWILSQQIGSQTSPKQTDLWKPFDETQIANHIANGQIVFVDITASWCLTCKVNKFTVLGTSQIETELSQNNVIAMQGDWTNKSENITTYIRKLNRAGIPFNIVYGPNAREGIILPELLTKQAVLDAMKKAK